MLIRRPRQDCGIFGLSVTCIQVADTAVLSTGRWRQLLYIVPLVPKAGATEDFSRGRHDALAATGTGTRLATLGSDTLTMNLEQF